MTVPVPDQLEYIYGADGVVKDFGYPKRFLQKDEIVVLLRGSDGTETPQILNTHFTIAGSTWASGGTITFYSAPASGLFVVLSRYTQAKQTVDLQNNQRNDAPSVETQLDRLTMAIQDRGALTDKAWALAIASALGLKQEIGDRIEADEALASLLGQIGPIEVPFYDTRLAASFAHIKPTINSIRTGGFSSSGDGGAALYKRVSGPTIGGFQSSDEAWWQIAENTVSPRMFGAKGDGVTDDTVAMQEAMSIDQPLFVDGHFRISDVCNYDQGGTKRIYGSGDSSSLITMTNPAGNGLSKTSGTLIVESIGITTTVDKNNDTAAIFIGGGFSGRDLVDNCRIYGQSDTIRLAMGISVESDVIPTIRSNYIVNCRIYGVILQNISNGAGGEAVVTANTFNTSDASNTATAIAWSSGQGAVRISDNVIQSYLIGVQLSPVQAVIKSSAIISSNSFENNGFASISISRPSGGGTIQAVNIVGNDFQNSTGRHLIVQDTDGDNLSFVRYINLTGNSHFFGMTAAVQIAAGVIFSMDGGVFETLISGLTPVVFSANAPITGQIGSNVFFGSGIAPYQLNGNTGMTKVSTTSA